jgi:hypothetical protein
MLFIGVDVGEKGGIAMIDEKGDVLLATKMPATDADILAVFPPAEVESRACLEKVHSSPQMGVASAFSFGGSYRALRMALTARGIPFDEVTPQVWQRRLECFSSGDKNVTKARAQQLFPGYSPVTHAVADALLLAEYCRRTQILDPAGVGLP